MAAKSAANAIAMASVMAVTGRAVPTCTKAAASPDIAATIARMDSITGTPVPETPVFIRPRNDGGNLYPNPDNTYVATIVDHRPGRVVVIRGHAPTFPDTRAGERVSSQDQVRYWSFCTNEYAKPYRVSACRNDARIATKGGDYTIVVSTRADRPKGLRATGGVTWLPWGSTRVPSLILLRQMLPSPDYANAAARLAPATALGDQITMVFGDGVFSEIPVGIFRAYVRASNGLQYIINPEDMQNVVLPISYTDRNGNLQTITLI